MLFYTILVFFISPDRLLTQCPRPQMRAIATPRQNLIRPLKSSYTCWPSFLTERQVIVIIIVIYNCIQIIMKQCSPELNYIQYNQ